MHGGTHAFAAKGIEHHACVSMAAPHMHNWACTCMPKDTHTQVGVHMRAQKHAPPCARISHTGISDHDLLFSCKPKDPSPSGDPGSIAAEYISRMKIGPDGERKGRPGSSRGGEKLCVYV